jgi:hypothetical protein
VQCPGNTALRPALPPDTKCKEQCLEVLLSQSRSQETCHSRSFPDFFTKKTMPMRQNRVTRQAATENVLFCRFSKVGGFFDDATGRDSDRDTDFGRKKWLPRRHCSSSDALPPPRHLSSRHSLRPPFAARERFPPRAPPSRWFLQGKSRGRRLPRSSGTPLFLPRTSLPSSRSCWMRRGAKKSGIPSPRSVLCYSTADRRMVPEHSPHTRIKRRSAILLPWRFQHTSVLPHAGVTMCIHAACRMPHVSRDSIAWVRPRTCCG